jgi:DNA-directed RNA polymerase subunit RPC12/RpoP
VRTPRLTVCVHTFPKMENYYHVTCQSETISTDMCFYKVIMQHKQTDVRSFDWIHAVYQCQKCWSHCAVKRVFLSCFAHKISETRTILCLDMQNT